MAGFLITTTQTEQRSEFALANQKTVAAFRQRFFCKQARTVSGSVGIYIFAEVPDDHFEINNPEHHVL